MARERTLVVVPTPKCEIRNLLLLPIDAVHGDDVVDEVPGRERAIAVRVPIDARRLVAHGIWQAITLRTAASQLPHNQPHTKLNFLFWIKSQHGSSSHVELLPW